MLYNSAEIMYLVSEVNVNERVGDGIVKMKVWIWGETNIPNPESFESKTDSNESFRIRIPIFESNIITMRNCMPAPRPRS